MSRTADLIIRNARVATVDKGNPQAQAFAVVGNKFLAVGDEAEVFRHRGSETLVIDAKGHRIIPGLIDSHIHVIRGGLSYNLELRWDGVPSLAEGMRLLKQQVARTPAPQWVRVAGGFTELQFAEKRLPTLDELNVIAPDTPVFILHLYDRALLNGAALRATGYTKDTPDPPGSEIVRDAKGNPTGLLLARPNALLLYSALAKGPKLPYDYQLNSTRHYMRELNRLGVTSVIDAGGGFQNYPDDYRVITDLHASGQLTLRFAYNLFTQNANSELEDFTRWTGSNPPHQGDDWYKLNGAGEMLVFSAADFENLRVPRPDMAARMEPDLEAVVRLLASKKWPWRMHATYDETIARALDVFEKVNEEIPFDGIHWFFDHAETISEKNIERVAGLGGGIAVQHRMMYQGEYFIERYGAEKAEHSPPVKKILEMGVPLGVGTDATRVASYDPWTALSWIVTGKTLGGTTIYPARHRIDRDTALDLYTRANTWFSREEGRKGQIKAGQLADFAILSQDFFNIPEDEIKNTVSLLTAVDGRIVYADGDFQSFDPGMPKAMPDWSPVNFGSKYWKSDAAQKAHRETPKLHDCTLHGHAHAPKTHLADPGGFWGALGCSCWAF